MVKGVSLRITRSKVQEAAMKVLDQMDVEYSASPMDLSAVADFQTSQRAYSDEDEALKKIETIHRVSVRSPLKTVAKELQNRLTRQLTAYIAGVKDGKTVTRWAVGEITDVRLESERQLRAAFEIVLILSVFDSPDVVRPWFIGANPHLNGVTPADAINAGNLKVARAAAFAFVANL